MLQQVARAGRPQPTTLAPGDTGAVKAGQPPRPGVSGALFDTTQRWTHLLIGLAVFAAQQSDDIYDAVIDSDVIDVIGTRPETAPPSSGRSGERGHVTLSKRARAAKVRRRRAVRQHGVRRGRMDGLVGLLPGATLGLGLAAQRRVFDHVSAAEGRAQRSVEWLTSHGPLGTLNRRLRDFLQHWDDQYRAQTDTHAELASDYLARIGPGALDALLARIDITALVDRVDINEAVDRVDLEALIDKVPVERVIDRVDLRAVVLDTVAQVQVTDILRESTGAMATRLTGGLFRTRPVD